MSGAPAFPEALPPRPEVFAIDTPRDPSPAPADVHPLAQHLVGGGSSSGMAGPARPAASEVPGYVVRLRNGGVAHVNSKGHLIMGGVHAARYASSTDLPLYDKNDAAAKERYKAAARQAGVH